jgi:Uma2 family endonuclease
VVAAALLSDLLYPLVVKLDPVIKMTDEQFFAFCQLNPDLRIEREPSGALIIMPPTGGITGNRNSEVSGQLWAWNRQTKLGKTFDSSTGFKLPNGAHRSPDAAWVRLERWMNLSSREQEKFVPLCPDFVVELRSLSDPLAALQDKMVEYINNGAELGWLIDRQQPTVYLYHSQQPVQCMVNPATLRGETTLPGFILDMSEVW